ncbi:MAG: NAD(P)H-dependent oxidoreductase [Calditrichaeota bacterium]|nr:NAD(P)H-dependent oxidoreductase [Calditrichota bacterium]
MNKKKILAISGSIQSNSVNKSIIKYITGSFDQEVMFDIYNQLDKLPHFNPDLDKDDPPEIIQNLRQQIDNADAVLICTPEYVFSLPGVLKNLIDWNVSSPVLINKPIGLIVAAASGQKAMESLDLILSTVQAIIVGKLIVNGAKGKIEKNGVIQDQKTQLQINAFMSQFIKRI